MTIERTTNRYRTGIAWTLNGSRTEVCDTSRKTIRIKAVRLSLSLLTPLFINPRHACTARVTVVVLCVCMYVCMCVCVYVCPLIPAASHIGITKERYQRILRNTGIVLSFSNFPKNASFKSYGVISLPRAAPAS